MSTRAHPLTRHVALVWEQLYPSAVCSGIAPDRRHLSQGGYHVSIQDNRPGTYSVVRGDDKAGPRDVSAAIDMSMSPADMKRCTGRLKRVYDNPDDPRRAYLNAFNGWTGAGDARRYDIWARVTSYATADHKWHVHAEFRRRFVDSPAAAKAFLSALAGESVAQYQASLRPDDKEVDVDVDDLLSHKIPFEYVDTTGKAVKTHLSIGAALTRAWTHDYDMRNKTLPALTKAAASLAAQVGGITALVKAVLDGQLDRRVDAAQLTVILERVDAAAAAAADRVIAELLRVQHEHDSPGQ